MNPMKTLRREAKSFYVPSDIERIEKPTPLEFYRDYVSKNRPVIITNAISHWPALHRWTDEYLSAKLGDRKVTVAVTPNGYADAIIQSDKFVMPEERRMTYSEFATLLQRNKGKATGDREHWEQDAQVAYISKQNGNLLSEFSELAPDVETEMDFASEALAKQPDAVNLWIGDSQSVTSLHKDPYENLYAVVSGAKIFTLYPPTDLPHMDYRQCRPMRYRYSDERKCWSVDPEPASQAEGDATAADDGALVPWISDDPLHPQPDTPFACDTLPLQFAVRKGEVLYLPSLWFHHVQQSEFVAAEKTNRVIAVNMWYDMDFGLSFVYFRFLEAYVHSHRKSLWADGESDGEGDEDDEDDNDESV